METIGINCFVQHEPLHVQYSSAVMITVMIPGLTSGSSLTLQSSVSFLTSVTSDPWFTLLIKTGYICKSTLVSED